MPTLLSPWVILGFVVALGSAGVGGYVKGRSDADANCELAAAKTRDATQKIVDAQAAVANTAATTLESGNANAKVIYRTITQNVDRVVEKPVYNNVCLDADGLQLANSALAGGASAVAAQPPAVLPAAPPAH